MRFPLVLLEPLGLIRLVHLPAIYFLLMHYCLLAEPLGVDATCCYERSCALNSSGEITELPN